MMRKAPKNKPKKGPQRLSAGRCPRLPGVLTATKVSRLEKVARSRAKLSVWARVRLPAPSRCRKAGPSEAARTAGQHQAPIKAGRLRAAIQPEPHTVARSDALSGGASEPSSDSSGSTEPSMPQPPVFEGNFV